MRVAILCAGSLLVWLSTLGRLSADQPESPAPLEKYRALVKAQQQAREQFSKAYNAAKTDEERQRVQKELGGRASADHYTGQFLQLIRTHPKDPAALEAFRWMLSRVPNSPETGQAVETLLANWIEDERLAEVCRSLVYRSCPAGDTLLQRAIDKSPHRTVQGYARFSLAMSLITRADRMTSARPEDRKPYEREAEKLLQQVIDKYADLKHFTTLGKAAELQLFALRHLAIGKTAPDIEGEDLDGKKMKLSDFRGKVVLLDFWGSW
jgi:flagellar motor protein MotB